MANQKDKGLEEVYRSFDLPTLKTLKVAFERDRERILKQIEELRNIIAQFEMYEKFGASRLEIINRMLKGEK
jgi:hypothetical protein